MAVLGGRRRRRARGPLEAATQRAGVGGRQGALAARPAALVQLVPGGTAVALPPFTLSGLDTHLGAGPRGGATACAPLLGYRCLVQSRVRCCARSPPVHTRAAPRGARWPWHGVTMKDAGGWDWVPVLVTPSLAELRVASWRTRADTGARWSTQGQSRPSDAAKGRPRPLCPWCRGGGAPRCRALPRQLPGMRRGCVPTGAAAAGVTAVGRAAASPGVLPGTGAS